MPHTPVHASSSAQLNDMPDHSEARQNGMPIYYTGTDSACCAIPAPVEDAPVASSSVFAALKALHYLKEVHYIHKVHRGGFQMTVHMIKHPDLQL